MTHSAAKPGPERTAQPSKAPRTSAKLTTRLSLTFAIICAAMLTIAAMNQWLSGRAAGSVAEAVSLSDNSKDNLHEVKARLQAVGTRLRDAGLSGDMAEVQKLLQAYEAELTAYRGALEQMTVLMDSAEEKPLAERIGRLNGPLQAELKRAVGFAKSLQGEAVKVVLLEKVAPIERDLLITLAELDKVSAHHAAQRVDAAFTESQRGAWIAMLVSVACSGMAAALAWRLTQDIKGAFSRAQEVVTRMASGDLTQAISWRRADEIGCMLQAMEAMRLKLVSVLSQVQGSIHSITHASNEIASGNTDLSSRTERQAAGLGATSSSARDLARSAQENADKAGQVRDMASHSDDSANVGREVIERVISTMQGIQQASHRISDINQLIDSLAFQTNILALNAAVEAARAGEQGRGFAVVAAEVRTLAQHSAKAAREIRELINSSMQTVELGAKQVNDAGDAVQQIAGEVGSVGRLITDIADRSRLQRETVQSVTQSIGELEGLTQQNATLVDQLAASSGSLHQQAVSLSTLVSEFQLPERVA